MTRWEINRKIDEAYAVFDKTYSESWGSFLKDDIGGFPLSTKAYNEHKARVQIANDILTATLKGMGPADG